MNADFSNIQSKKVVRFGHDASYSLVPQRDVELNDVLYDSILSCCLEEKIYKWLFDPKDYTKKDAIEFMTWARRGWDNQTHFTFLVLDSEKRAVGAFDIKENNLEVAEIGYWVSQNHSGLARNCVAELKNIAREAGFKKLYAQIKSGNDASLNVLLNNGFSEDEKYKTRKECDRGFVVDLS